MECGAAKLLVIEDESQILALLCERLEAHGYRICTAESAAQAATRLAAETFDLLLLDIGLPDADGLDVLAQIRRDHPMESLPVLVLTGDSARASVLRALSLGANDYVTKPLDLPVILARIRTQLTLKQALDARRRLEADLERKNGELQRVNRDLLDANRVMREDVQSAAAIQQAHLPTALPAAPGLEFSWVYQPCETLGGDLLNIFEIDEHHIGMYMLDVSGHGVRAALLSVAVSKLLVPHPDQSCLVRRRRDGTGPLEPTPPDAVARALNARFPLDDRTEQYFTLFYGVLDTRSMELEYVSCGQPGPLHIRPGAGPQNLHEPVFAIGWTPDAQFPSRRCTLRHGDRFVVVSDGLAEARGASGVLFGADRLADVLSECREFSLDDGVRKLIDAAQRWSGRAFEDDVSVLAIEVRAPRPAAASERPHVARRSDEPTPANVLILDADAPAARS
jgi:phosphoserine phosphatase RsbU/P